MINEKQDIINSKNIICILIIKQKTNSFVFWIIKDDDRYTKNNNANNALFK